MSHLHGVGPFIIGLLFVLALRAAALGQSISITDAPRGVIARIRATSDDRLAIRQMACSADGKILMTVAAEPRCYPLFAEQIRVWDVDSQTELFQIRPVECVRAVLSPDGQRLAVLLQLEDPIPTTVRRVGEEGLQTNRQRYHHILNLYDTHSGQLLRRIRSRQEGTIAFNPEGDLLGFANNFDRIQVWDQDVSSHQHSLKSPLFWEGEFQSFWFSKDEQYLVTCEQAHYGKFGTRNGPIRLWDRKTGTEVRRFPSQSEGCAVSHDGQLVVGEVHDRRRGRKFLAVWKLATGELVGRGPRGANWHGWDRRIQSLAFTPHDRSIVQRTHGGTISIIDWRTGKTIHRITEENVGTEIESMTVDSTHQRLYTGMGDGTVLVWNLSELPTKDDGMEKPKHTEPEGVLGDTLPPGVQLRLGTTRFRVYPRGNSFYGYRRSPLQFTPNGKWLAAQDRRDVVVWEAATGSVVQRLPLPECNAFAFSADGRRIVTGSENMFRVWETVSGKEVLRRTTYQLRLDSVAFSPDGTTIVTTSVGEPDFPDQRVRIWNATNGEAIHTFNLKDLRAASVAFSPDSRMLAVATGTLGVSLLNLRTFRLQKKLHTQATTSRRAQEKRGGPPDEFVALAFSPDGDHVFGRTKNGDFITWQVASGQQTSRLGFHRPESGSLPDDRMTGGIAASRDGRVVASINTVELKAWKSPSITPSRRARRTRHSTVHLWESETGWRPRSIANLGHPQVFDVAVSPDGELVATSGGDATVRTWNATTGQPIRQPDVHTDRVVCLAFSPDGTQIASGGADRTVRVWEVSTGRQLHVFTGHAGPITSVAFSPNGKHLLTTVDDMEAHWRNLSMSGERRIFKPDQGERLASAKIHPNNRQVYLATDTGRIIVADLASGEVVNSYSLDFTGKLRSVGFSPDGTSIVTVVEHRKIFLWNAATGEQLLHIDTPGGTVNSVWLSPDAKLLGTRTQIWNAETGAKLSRLQVGYRPMFSSYRESRQLAISPDNQYCATEYKLGVLGFWRVGFEQPLARVPAHNATISCVTFSADGSKLATGSHDSTILIWDVEQIREPVWED